MKKQKREGFQARSFALLLGQEPLGYSCFKCSDLERPGSTRVVSRFGVSYRGARERGERGMTWTGNRLQARVLGRTSWPVDAERRRFPCKGGCGSGKNAAALDNTKSKPRHARRTTPATLANADPGTACARGTGMDPRWPPRS